MYVTFKEKAETAWGQNVRGRRRRAAAGELECVQRGAAFNAVGYTSANPGWSIIAIPLTARHDGRVQICQGQCGRVGRVKSDPNRNCDGCGGDDDDRGDLWAG